jgi:hypothetical protein
MASKTLTKIVAGFLLVSQLALLPLFASAQITVPVFDSNNGSSPGGLAGIAANTAQAAAFQVPWGAYQACLLTQTAFDNGDSAKNLSFSGLNLISGGVDLVAQYDAELVAYTAFLNCAQTNKAALNLLPAGTVYLSNAKQQMLTQMNSAIATYQAKWHNAEARQANATQGFWKTLVFNLLIKVGKSVVTTLVNKLVQNYKINNLKQYIDSVATLMYDNQYIRDNFPSAQGQLMARAVLQNPLFRTQIQPAVFMAANSALSFTPGTVSPSDPNFYAKMNAVGSSGANPFVQQAVLVSSVDQSHSNALATTQLQVAQSNGYKAPVNCAGSLAQQQAIDAQNVNAQNQLANRQALLYNLQTGGGSASDIAKAQANVNTAQAQWNALPYTVTGTSSVSNIGSGGGNNTEGTMAIIMCEAINSPAALINQGINAAITHYGGNLTQYNNNNLPAFINIITDVSSQIVNSLVLGGLSGAGSAALINENKTVSAVAVAGSQAAYSNSLANLANNVEFDPPVYNNSSPNSWTLSWNVITSSGGLSNAAYVTISGDGISATNGINSTTKKPIPNSLPLSGSYNITTTVGGTYTLTVYDVNGNPLTSVTQTITPVGAATPASSPSATTLGFNDPATEVLGAFAEIPQASLRGPQNIINIRGPQ